MILVKKKKKKKDKIRLSLSPSGEQKTKSRLSMYVERSLDFGQDSDQPLPASASSFKRQLLSNRYVILSESNMLSVVDFLPSTTSNQNTVNDTITFFISSSISQPIFSHQSSVNSNTDTQISIYGTPSSHSHIPSSPTSSHVIPDFPKHFPTITIAYTSSTTSTTTSLTSSILVTSTTLTYTHGTITHSTSNHSPQHFIPPSAAAANYTTLLPSPPLPHSPPHPHTSHEMDFHSVYDTHHAQQILLPTTLTQESVDPPPASPVAAPASNPPTLYPNVIIQPPVFQSSIKRKWDNPASDSHSSPDHSDKSIRKLKKITLQAINNLNKIAALPLSNINLPVSTTPRPTTPPSSSTNKPPAIHIYTADYNHLIKLINSKASTRPSFKYNNTSLICFPNSAQDHPRILKILQQSNIEYYTHNLINSRPVKLAVKYSPQDIPDDDILADLRIKDLPIIKISRVMTSKQGKRSPSNILILTVPREAACFFYSLTDLCHLKITVSDYYGPPLNQCHNCPGFAHSSEMCGKTAKCIKCGQSHRGQPCSSSELKCANCSGNHSANFRGCPAYQAALQRYAPKSINPTTTSAPPQRSTIPPLNKQNFPLLPNRVTLQPQTQPNPNTAWNTQSNNNQSVDPLTSPLKDIISFLKSFNFSKI